MIFLFSDIVDLLQTDNQLSRDITEASLLHQYNFLNMKIQSIFSVKAFTVYS